MPTRDGPANPFQPAPGATPPLLVGRAAERASIRDACDRVARGSAPTPIAFVGLRGLGKTVLLNRIREQTLDGVHLHVEVEPGVALVSSIRSALDTILASVTPTVKRVAKAIESALRYLPMPSLELPGGAGAVTLAAPAEQPVPEQRQPLSQAIQALNEAVASAHKYLVITVDEVQDIDIAGFRSLVACVHRSAGSPSPILLACAGLPEAHETFRKLRTYAKRWDRFDLQFLTRAETIEAIRTPIRAAGASIADDAIDLLAEESAGYPFFVQKYASAVWNHHRGNKILLSDVQAIVPEVRALVERLFYADDLDRLSPRERMFCKALADLGEGPHALGEVAAAFGVPSSAVSSIRSNLIKKGVVFVPSSGMLEFRMPLAERYVREHASLFPSPLTTPRKGG